MWNEYNFPVVCTLPFVGIGMKTDLFQSCGHCWVFQICWCIESSTLKASSFRIWNSSTIIPSPLLALFVVMLSKDHLHMVLSPEIISIRHKNTYLGYGNDQFPYYRAPSFTQVPQIKRNTGMLYRQWIWNSKGLTVLVKRIQMFLKSGYKVALNPSPSWQLQRTLI